MNQEDIQILVLHGPNLNLLGMREPEIYGRLTLAEINQRILSTAQELGVGVRIHQSNSEGALIDRLHEAREWASGVLINPGGYTHTSVSIRDAITAIGIPTIEVHLSNIHRREEFRRHSVITPVCLGIIAGFGWHSYILALYALAQYLRDDRSTHQK